eukprot:gb/GFBE01004324.1/.p1 GENE.gb/GFBE01004324.1/~~gb/GFBE01004324.1/.p1  ORF type:complete len:275 (+),score=43.30 gb/GFBE01004324.1/:1-825(+)
MNSMALALRRKLTLGVCTVCCLRLGVLGLEILDVGPPRTGSQTLHEAFGILGITSLHSGYSLPQGVRTACTDYIAACGNNASKLRECLDTFKGYQAAMDEPFHLLYEEVLRDNPSAKFVLPVPDAEHWYQSYLNFYKDTEHSQQEQSQSLGLLQINLGIASTSNASSQIQEVSGSPEVFTDNMIKCLGCKNWGCEFAKETALTSLGIVPDPAIKRQCLANYQRHVDRVQAVIPKAQLLIFDYSDGWGPLADFLGKPVPEIPFPYVDKFNDEHSD